MKGLLVKDFRLMLQQKRFFLILIFVAILLNFNSDGSFVLGYLTFVCSIFVLSTITYDEYDNCYSFLMTLPIDRKTYAKEKYCFGFMICFGAWLVGFIISLFFQITKMPGFVLKDAILTALLYIPLFMILIDIMLPFHLKYGGEKGRLAMLGTFGVILLAGYLILKVMETSGIDMIKILDSLSAWSFGLLDLAAFVLAIIATLISYLISASIMTKKEF